LNISESQLVPKEPSTLVIPTPNAAEESAIAWRVRKRLFLCIMGSISGVLCLVVDLPHIRGIEPEHATVAKKKILPPRSASE